MPMAYMLYSLPGRNIAWCTLTRLSLSVENFWTITDDGPFPCPFWSIEAAVVHTTLLLRPDLALPAAHDHYELTVLSFSTCPVC